jgi:hypothetical protein
VASPRSIRSWLSNPFQYLAGAGALAAGIVLMVGAGLLGSLSNSHFDGVLDFHTGAPAPRWLFLAEGLVDWVALCLPLWLGGLLLSKRKFRALDLVGTQALARFPTLVPAALALLPGYQRYGLYLQARILRVGPTVDLATGDAVVFGFVTLAMLVAVVWMVVLMYRAFALSCNVQGARAIGVFSAALLVGEVASKLAIGALLKAAV